jgi:hypothetical protein
VQRGRPNRPPPVLHRQQRSHAAAPPRVQRQRERRGQREVLDYIEGEMAKRGVTQQLIDDTRAATEKQMLVDMKKIVASGGDLEAYDSQGATPVGRDVKLLNRRNYSRVCWSENYTSGNELLSRGVEAPFALECFS